VACSIRSGALRWRDTCPQQLQKAPAVHVIAVPAAWCSHRARPSRVRAPSHVALRAHSLKAVRVGAAAGAGPGPGAPLADTGGQCGGKGWHLCRQPFAAETIHWLAPDTRVRRERKPCSKPGADGPLHSRSVRISARPPSRSVHESLCRSLQQARREVYSREPGFACREA